MWKVLIVGLFFACCCSLPAAERPPSASELPQLVRKEHPRLFLTPERLLAFRERARTVLKAEFDKLVAEVEALPADPKLEFIDDYCTVEGRKITFKRLLNDQNACSYAVKTTGGDEALRCALVWLVTGQEAYRIKALKYLKMNVDFTEYCKESRILYEWFHFTRLNAIVAYDWLASTLSPAERKALMKPMLDHVSFMRNPGFLYNNGGVADGNYGDPALMWYAGLATFGDGVDDPQAAKLLRDGYRLFVGMMDHRDHISGGSGVLTSICSGYSFGMYPLGSFNFLHTLDSGAGIDGTKYWTQVRDYPNWFVWAVIRGRDGLFEYGFGDAFHRSNRMGTYNMYTHLAQVIHFYGKRSPFSAELARAAMAILPKENCRIVDNRLPYLPYILTGFDPERKSEKSVDELLENRSGEFFRNAGLAVMRSGFGEDDTYAAFKAGAKFNAHQHYDENTFVIYRSGFQALDTGGRGSAPHHRVYYPQTIAHNAMLIRMKDEPLARYWYPANAPEIGDEVHNDGGQDTQKAGRNLGFESNQLYAATGGDATKCYSDRKCREAVRIFVFVKPDYFIIYDRVEAVEPDQEKAFVLHFAGEPQEIAPGLFRSGDGDGVMFTRTLLPRRAVTEKIGGEGRDFWTNGKNWLPDGYARFMKEKNYLGRWRLEVKPGEAALRNRFLHLLQTGKASNIDVVEPVLIDEPGIDGRRFRSGDGVDTEIRFRREGIPGGTIRMVRNGETVLAQELFQPGTEPREELRHSARIDVEHRAENGKFRYIDNGNASYRELPRWMSNGRGALTQFAAQEEWREGDFGLLASGSGEIRIGLLGPDMRDKSGKRLRKYIEFGSVKVNGRELLPDGKPVRVWHDEPKRITLPVADGEELHFSLRYRTVE